METYQVGLIGLAFFAVFVFFAVRAWRQRRSKQEVLLESPKFLDFDIKGFKTLYVTTTFSGRPLDRVIAHGLAHRGRATLDVSDKGISVFRTGERSFLIPAERIVEVTDNSAVIDRAVETNGLLTIIWKLGDESIDSHFRFVDSAAKSGFLDATKTIVRN